MIPKIIHYCWFGGNPLPELAQRCLDSWKQHMPEYEIRQWDETNFDIDAYPYAREAYDARKFAFVSDITRLVALEQYGGIYFDTDVEVLHSFDALITDNAPYHAFIGFEESLAHLPGTCVMACEPHCEWVQAMLATYHRAQFVRPDGSLDMTTNVQRLGQAMVAHGLVPNGQEQVLEEWGVHVYPHDYFSPITSTRVLRRTSRTMAIHHYAGSWTNGHASRLRDLWLVREGINLLVQMKRRMKG